MEYYSLWKSDYFFVNFSKNISSKRTKWLRKIKKHVKKIERKIGKKYSKGRKIRAHVSSFFYVLPPEKKCGALHVFPKVKLLRSHK